MSEQLGLYPEAISQLLADLHSHDLKQPDNQISVTDLKVDSTGPWSLICQ
jgi:hypothetical protein